MLFGYKILIYCTSKIYESKFCDFVSTLNDELVPHNWRILTFCTETDLFKGDRNSKGEKNIFDLINYDIADAVLYAEEKLLDEKVKNKILERAKKHKIPVFVYEGNNPDTFNIKFDMKKGFYKVVHHIIGQHGIRDVHFMSGTKGSWQAEERLQVFKDVLAENDIPFDESMVSYGDFWERPTAKATYKLLERDNIPKAIICANDMMALSVISVIKKKGYRCPEDIIVSGFDGVENIFYSTPKITSALCNYQTLGIEVANYIEEVYQVNPKPTTRLIDPSFIISESCGCQPVMPANSLDFITKLSERYGEFRDEEKSLSNMSVCIHDSNSIEEVRKNIRPDLLYDARFLLKKECINQELDPNKTYSDSTYGDEMFVMVDPDKSKYESCPFIKTSDLIPDMKEILEKNQKPLIFTPVNNIDMPLGYLCFCFSNYDVKNYAKITQIATWLGNAISGYRNVQYQKKLQQKIEDMYSHDSLTNLYNRNGFIKIYEGMLDDESISKISLAMCDLDNLKHLNDNFSHSEGDNAIKQVAKALANALQGGYYCRYGGDELLALYPFEVKYEDLQKKIDLALDKYNQTSGKSYQISASLGVYTSGKTAFETLFKNADELMYQQKQKKKNHRQ
ncbi:MAG: GGDEF domain-containing protein [Treponema sp.]|nr:GGDEF domain-containing protein [Treponema sp.]